MDVVYLCRPGDNPELMYSLRSLRNLPHDRVWIFGDAPHWVTNINLVITPQSGTKHRTTNHSLRAACEHPDVSDPFLLFNDDFMIMRPIEEVPIVNLGPIRDVAAGFARQGLNGGYVQGMIRTAELLENMGYENPLSFEAHIPLPVNKQVMLDALNLGPYQRRSVYGNLAGYTGDTIRDVKIHRRRSVPRGPFLSTSDATINRARPLLNETFPTPSPYEVSDPHVNVTP